MREMTLGIGDLSAPPGSREWAIAVRAQIQVAIKDSSSDRENLQAWLALMERHQGYKSLENARGRKFNSYEDFCMERLPYGLCYSQTMESDIKNAVDAAFARGLVAQNLEDKIILPEEIAFGLLPRLVRVVQREIDSRFLPNGKMKHPDAPSPRSKPARRGSR
jgi:hypothetical protein